MPAMQLLEGRVLLAAVGVADNYIVAENQSGTPNTLNAASVLLNDSGATSAILASGPGHAASFEFRADGTFTYTPATGYDGQDTFTYRASDGASESDPVLVTIKVNNQPLALSKSHDYQGGNGPALFHVADFAYDTDDTQFIFIPPLDDWHLQGPVYGTVLLSADKKTFTYTPRASYTGDDSFQFRVNDGHLSSNEGTIRLLNIASANPVVANNDFFEIAAGTTLNLPAPFLLMNDDDNAGTGTLSVAEFTPSAQGTAQVSPDGSFTFTPNAGFSGNATFTYRTTNGSAVSEPATVLVHVSGAAQIAAGDYYFVAPGQTINIAGPGVLANDIYSGAAPAVNQEKGANMGSLSLRQDGGFTYTAPANPAEQFTYFRYQHGSGGSADRIATVYLIFQTPAGDVINGTAGNDAFHVATEAATGDLLVWHNQPVTGPATHRFDAASVTSLKINGLGGNDTLTIDLANSGVANPLAAGIAFDGGDGADRLVLANMPAGATMNVGAAALQLGSAQVSHAQVETVALDVTDGSGRIDLAALSLAAGTKLVLPDDDAKYLRTGTLNLGSGATLDLRKMSLVVQTPAGSAVPFASVLNLVRSARNGATLWSGSGIGTSSADAYHGLLAMLNSDNDAPILSTLGGFGLDARSIIILYTLNGDCNGDRMVDANDYFHMDHSYLNGGGTSPQAGDADYSGTIDGDDFFITDRAFLNHGSAHAVQAAGPVLESAIVDVSSTTSTPRAAPSAALFSTVRIDPPPATDEGDEWEWDSRVRDLLDEPS